MVKLNEPPILKSYLNVQEMKRNSGKGQSLLSIQFLLISIFVLIGLFFVNRYNFLLFHVLVELFSIIIAWSIFAFAWNSRRYIENDFLVFLGISYLFVGILDLVHTLSYEGMHIIYGYNANLPTQLWIAARYLQSLSFLIAPVFFTKKLKHELFFAVYALITTLILFLAFKDFLPVCYIDGSGLTAFKQFSEYIISLFFIGSIFVLYKKRGDLDKNVFKLMVLSVILTIVSEISFTLYIDLFGLFNFLGHIFKIFAFYLVYTAIIQTGFITPYNLLFRNLKTARDELEKLATHDNLTKLPNRVLFNYHLQMAILKAKRESNKTAVLFLDLDNFKYFNDTFGHSTGDFVLQKAAQYLKSQLRESDSVYRIGGDEFVIILENLKNEESILEIINRIFNNNREILLSNDVAVSLTFSMGISRYPDDGSEVETLLHKADQAMYYAKDNGKNSYLFYYKINFKDSQYFKTLPPINSRRTESPGTSLSSSIGDIDLSKS